MIRSIKEINDKIKSGKAIIITKDELLAMIEQKGYKESYKEVDVVTTATFGPMCSSGIYFNTGHSVPKIKLGGGRVTVDDVPCYTGFAAVDLMLGATAMPVSDPLNSIYPGSFKFGGAHVIQKLVQGEQVVFKATAYGTDCYPRKGITTKLGLADLNEAILFNMRNCYQNYNTAVNLSDKPVYTYMGMLKPNLGNASFCSAGYYSPLLCDPYYRTIGIGTKIFLGGGIGFVSFWGTQHNPCVERTKLGIPKRPAGTLAVIGNLKEMSGSFLKAVSLVGYGVSLSVGIGIPIPIIDEDVFKTVCVRDEEIYSPVVDYSRDYPQGTKNILTEVSYRQLRSGNIELNNKNIPTGSLSSLRRAKEIAAILKKWIRERKFFLTEKVGDLLSCGSEYNIKPLKERSHN